MIGQHTAYIVYTPSAVKCIPFNQKTKGTSHALLSVHINQIISFPAEVYRRSTSKTCIAP